MCVLNFEMIYIKQLKSFAPFELEFEKNKALRNKFREFVEREHIFTVSYAQFSKQKRALSSVLIKYFQTRQTKNDDTGWLKSRSGSHSNEMK